MNYPQAVCALPKSLLTSKGLARLRNTCYNRIGEISSTADPDMLQQFLVTVFGDVPAIIASAEQLCEFCLLPHTAVLVWARADNLRVHSENCVVLLLSAWIHAYGNVHGAALEDDMEASSDDEDDKNAHLYVELANCVRVLQLSPSYLQHIVPKLSWFQGCRGIKFLPHLQLQKSAGLDVDVQGSSARDFCAPSWLANAREAADSMPSSSTEWVVKSAELELMASSSEQQLFSPSVYRNGAFFKFGLQQEPSKPGSIALSVHFEVAELARVSCFRSFGSSSFVTAAEVAVTILHPHGDGHTRKLEHHRIYSSARKFRSWPVRLAPSSSSVTAVAEALAPYLFDGSLRLKVREVQKVGACISLISCR